MNKDGQTGSEAPLEAAAMAPDAGSEPPGDALSDAEFEHLGAVVAELAGGLDIRSYNRRELSRRALAAARRRRHDQLGAYLNTLTDETIAAEFLRFLLVPVTSFFRDPPVWECVGEAIQRRIEQDPLTELRFWIAGCATGEEAYTLAMVCDQAFRAVDTAVNYRVFATDVDQNALRSAAQGVFNRERVAAIPEPIRARYLEPREEEFIVDRGLRERVLFTRHDLLRAAPFLRMDGVFCRNVLIYLTPAARRRALDRLCYGLVQGGLVVLGQAETDPYTSHQLVRQTAPGVFISAKIARRAVEFDQRRSPFTGRRHHLGRPAVYQDALSALCPRWVIVGRSFEVLAVSSGATDLVTRPGGRLSAHVADFMIPALGHVVAGLISVLRSSSGQDRVDTTELPDGTRVIVQAYQQAEREDGLSLVTFVFAEPVEITTELTEDQEELTRIQAHLRRTTRELSRVNEQLAAANEELQAANEELQTVNEELQTVNEELHSVNADYRAKLLELQRSDDDLGCLLSQSATGAVFLDGEGRVRRYNEMALDYLPLRVSDVGRPVMDISLRLDCPEFSVDLQRCMDSGASTLRRARGDDGRVVEVVTAGRPAGGISEGTVVISFRDVTDAAESEAQADILEWLQQAVFTHRGGVAWLELGTGAVALSPRFEALSGWAGDAEDQAGLLRHLTPQSKQREVDRIHTLESGEWAEHTWEQQIQQEDQKRTVAVRLAARRSLISKTVTVLMSVAPPD